MEKIILTYQDKIKKWGIYIISVPIFLMTIIDSLNVLGRKLFIPFPCAIESIEALLVISIYFGVPIVASEGGHVNVTLVTRKLPASMQYFLDALVNLLATVIFGFLTWGAWGAGFQAWRIMEIRMGIYLFPIWPFKILYAVGLTMFTIQLAFNAIKFTHAAVGHTNYAGVIKVQQPGLV